MQNKKFFIGLPPMESFGTYQDLDHLCKKYINIIDTWYVTPPFGQLFQTRDHTLSICNKQNINELQQCFQIIKDNNLKIQFAFNSQTLKKLKISQTQEVLDICIQLFGKPDSIVTLDNLLPLFSLYNIPLTYSFNNNYSNTKFKNLHYCNTLVLGGTQYLKNFKFMENIKNKYPYLQIELLLNNGCHLYCDKNCKNCQKNFDNIPNVKQKKYIDILVDQVLFPSELKYYPSNLIDSYKLSSRPCTKEYLDWELYHFSNYIDIKTILQELDLTRANNWYYLSRLSGLINWLKQFEPIDINTIILKKEEKLSKILNKNIKL